MKRSTLSVLAVVSLVVGLLPLTAGGATEGNVVEVTVDAPTSPAFAPVNTGQETFHPHGRGTCDGWEILNNSNLDPAGPPNSELSIRITPPEAEGDTPFAGAETVAPGASFLLADTTAATTRDFRWGFNAGPGDDPPAGELVAFTLTRDLSPCHDLAGDYDAYEALFSSQTEATGTLVIPTPANACGAVSGSVAGNIVLVETGACSAAAAYTNVLNAGAIGVIFYGGSQIFLNGAPATTTIPAVMIAEGVGDDLAAAVGAGQPVTLTIGDEPTDTIEGPTWTAAMGVTARSETGLTITWTAPTPGSAAITGYRVYQGDTLVASPGSGAVSQPITDLTPGTTYNFTVIADDGLGLESEALNGSFATLIGPTWPGGAQLGAQSIGQTSLTLTWPAATDPDGGLSGYRVYRDDVLVDTALPGATTFPVSGLDPETTYDFSVVAFDSDDLESDPLEESFATASLTGPYWNGGALSVTNRTTTTVDLSWPAASDDDGTVENYRVEVDGVPRETLDAATLNYQVTGLTPGTTYTFSVHAIDDDDLEDFLSAPGTTLIAPIWPGGAVLGTLSIAKTSVTLTWPAATDPDDGLDGYRVFQEGDLLDEVGPGVTSYLVSDLTPGTSYDFSVVAYDTDDLVSPALENTFTTAPLNAPYWSPDAALTISNRTTTTVDLSWPAASDDDGTVDNYRVEVDGTPRQTLSGATLTYQVTGLTPGTTYNFTVVAIDDDDLETQLGAPGATLDPPAWPGGALTATNVRQRMLTLNWPAATDSDGTIQSYQIFRDGGLIGTVNGSTNSFPVSGLIANTSYDFAVVAIDNDDLPSVGLGASIATANWVPSTVGAFDPNTGQWFLMDGEGNVTVFYFGNPGDIPMMGDWDCDGVDTVGLYRQSTGFAYIRNSNTQGAGERTFFFGLPGDIPLAGDFDGDGCDTVGVYRPSQGRVFIANTLPPNGGALTADTSYFFGVPGDKPFVGDFDGDGMDTVGLHRESTGYVYFRNTHSQGVADSEFFFGIPNDRLVAGDWGLVDGKDSPAVFRPGVLTWYFRHTNTQGNADSQFVWGDPVWRPVAGKFGLDD